MKLLLIVSVLLLGSIVAEAQKAADTKCNRQEEKTTETYMGKKVSVIKVNKRSKVETELEEPELAEDEADVSLATPEKEAKAEDNKRLEEAVKTPKLSAGEYALIDIKPFDSTETNLQGKTYIVYDYTIDKYGLITEINIHKSNDAKFKGFVIRKLQQTQWRPAENAAGKPITYKFPQQVAFLNTRTYNEEDYYRYD